MPNKFSTDLKSYWKYFCYICEHKYYVFLDCLKTGQIWHGITHDLSKFLPSEFFPYARKFFFGDYAYKYFEVEFDFEKAWLLHQHRNKHHWDYWVNSQGRAIPMPKKYILQMIIDWRAMGSKFKDTAKEFFERDQHKMILHHETIWIIKELLNG